MEEGQVKKRSSPTEKNLLKEMKKNYFFHFKEKKSLFKRKTTGKVGACASAQKEALWL